MDKFHQWSRLQVNPAKCKAFYMQNNMLAFCDTIMLPIRYLGVPWTIGRVLAECRTLNEEISEELFLLTVLNIRSF